MRIAIAKPDWRIVGGFELLLERIQAELVARGHKVVTMPVDVPSTSRTPYGVVVPDRLWSQAPDYFRYLSLHDTFRRMEFPAGTDAVISTQPPSFAVGHRAHVAMFFHHARVFYDLCEEYIAAGYARADRHRRAAEMVRAVDDRCFRGVGQFLVSSQELAGRLRSFNGINGRTMPFHPPPISVGGPGSPDRVRTQQPVVLCVSRHEFPKRTELFVQAMHLLPAVKGVSVGGGGREGFARSLDADFASGRRDPREATERDTWLNLGRPARRNFGTGIVTFAGWVGDDDLANWYRSATCVVAPAFREDYGLTVLEAMAFGKPVIVCKDGGGLVEFVEHGETGLLADPTADSLAQAVQSLVDDPERAHQMGIAARERSRSYTWSSAVRQLEAALEAVTS